MSNPSVGQVYQQIIRDVIETSRVDFEEGGVEESVLEELAQGWQKKLSALNVAQFPWDPKQESAPPIQNPPSVASNYQQTGTPPIPQQPVSTFSLPPLPPMQPMNDNQNGPRIKTEPGLENGMQGGAPQPFNNMSGMNAAQQRAAQNLQAQYGSRAAASISAIQGGAPQQQGPQHGQPQQQRPQGQGQGGMQRPSPQLTQQQYQQAMAQQIAAQSQRNAQAQNQGGVNGAQTDGAGDMDESVGVMKCIKADGEEVVMGRIEIDHMIREKIEAMGRSMEGGGLMLPLHERYPAVRSKKRIVVSDRQLAGAQNSSSSVPAQFDGGDDDDEDDKDGILKDEDDEDAINSDLDDPDDGLNEEDEDDEGLGHIMLCMYDKVQRVKNKWKCVMKDGVLTVNGKEYVFHKASGEYEW